MKAWLVREKDEFCATVVFAETRGKARSTALATDCCEDSCFCDIEGYTDSHSWTNIMARVKLNWIGKTQKTELRS